MWLGREQRSGRPLRPFAALVHLIIVSRLSDISICDALLARARRKESAAQAEIYAAVAPALFALIRRLVGNRAVAEDLYQDALVTFFEHLSDFRGEAPLGAWLRQIAVSKCLMYLRSPWHRARLHLESDEGSVLCEPLLPTPAMPPEVLDVKRALTTLTPTARAVVWLFDVEGYSHEEIARMFGRSISFSKSQLARAHARLRAGLEPHGDEETCAST